MRKLYGAAAASRARKLARTARSKSKRKSRRAAPTTKRKSRRPATAKRKTTKRKSRRAVAAPVARRAAPKRRPAAKRRRSTAIDRGHAGAARRFKRRQMQEVLVQRKKARRHLTPSAKKAFPHLTDRERKILMYHHEATQAYKSRQKSRASFKRRRLAGQVYGPIPNPRPSTQRSLARARRAVRNRYQTPLARAFKRRFNMRSNPASIAEFVGMLVPVAGSFFASRVVSAKVAPMIPGFSSLPATAQGPAMSLIVLGGAHLATSHVQPLKKHRNGIMIGAGLGFFESVIKSFAPTNVRALLGMGGIYDSALSDYVQTGDYLQTGDAPPIDDDITLAMADYVAVGSDGLQEELGIEEELGLEEELGDDDPLSRAYLGGTARGSMLAPVQKQKLLAPVPQRSFTREVARAGQGYDKGGVLYTGIFAR